MFTHDFSDCRESEFVCDGLGVAADESVLVECAMNDVGIEIGPKGVMPLTFLFPFVKLPLVDPSVLLDSVAELVKRVVCGLVCASGVV